MKTLVVVAALAALAAAAPTLYEDNYWGNVKSAIAYPQAFKRDRKSTQVEPKIGLVPTPGAPVVSPASDLPTARTFGLKKPIIVKKKEGYHVYRDSDEEQADSRETCVKQVKVKLCDTEHIFPKSSDMTRASGLEDPNVKMTEDEMKHSIQLAKEAVESIQRDLKKAEHTGDKALKHDNSETDTELHHDIEIARQALEHIHQNFGNLESMSLHEQKPQDLHNAETKENHHFDIARTEEERLAQWKEAVENIHRNVEIARNIEDSFKLEDEQLPLPEDDAIHTEMRATETDNEEHKLKSEDHTKPEKTSDLENLKSALHDDDMSTSAATLSEIKAINHINEEELKSASKEKVEKTVTEENKEPGRESDMETLASNHESQVEAFESKPKEDFKERKSETDKKELVTEESGKHKEELKHKEEPMTDHAKDAIDTTMFVKSAEPTKTDKDTVMLTAEIKNVHDELKKSPMKEKDVEEILSPLLGAITDPSNIDIEMKAADHSKHFHEDMKGHKETSQHHDGHHHIHMPHHHEHNHHQQSTGHSQMRWHHDNKNVQMAAMKAAEDIQSPIEHHHHLTEHAMRNHFDAKNLALHQQHHMFPETMMQGKSADMDNTLQFMNMRDSTGDNQRFRWRPAHESSRAAYGPAPAVAAASSGGAVGLFPNANVGSCGIPLLLSCNPSVVSGSLAKSHSYGAPAPAYRSEDDFNFHNKRDVKKTETLTALNRLPTTLNSKKTSILVAKQ